MPLLLFAERPRRVTGVRFFHLTKGFIPMKNKALLSSIFVLGCMSTAHAADSVTGLYVGGSLGVATTTASLNNSDVDLSVTDKTDQALSLRTGYRFNSNLAVEGGYADLGKMKYQQSGWPNGAIKTTLWHIDAVGILPLADKIAIFGKLGMARMNYEEEGYSAHKTTPHLGFGVSYALAPTLDVRAEYDHYGKARFSEGEESLDLRSSQFSLGMDYRF
jgi:OOP family OmpA-OmpF porin